MSQTAEQIAQWAEGKADAAKPQGKAAHLTPEQRQAIRVAYLETGGNVTYADMGRRCAAIVGREVNRETVAACLKGPAYDKLRKHFDTEIKASAVERLKAGILPAADAWVKAVDVAADKGDHKPAKELLLHTGTIDPLDADGRAQGPLVLVYVGNGKTPIGPNPFRAGGVLNEATGEYTGEVIEGEVAESQPMYRATVNGESRLLTKDQAQQLSAKHPMAIQIGIPAEDVTLIPAPQYRVAGTNEVLTADQVRERTEKQDAVMIGVQLPGIGQ
jgi:hypothetical protein